MTMKLRMWIAGATVTAILGLAYLSSPVYAAGDKDIEKSVKAVADLFKNGKTEDAKKLAAKTAKGIEDLPDLMDMFKPTAKGGLNIENDLKKPDLKKAVQLGNVTASMGEIILGKAPTKDGPKGKTKKAWQESAEQMREAGLEIAKAKDAKALKTAAAKAEAACTNCHIKFKNQ